MVTAAPSLTARVQRVCESQIESLLGRQRATGHWEAELEANDTITAEWILLRRLLGRIDPERERAATAWLRARQHPDGAWRIEPDGPGDLSVTTECYFALKVVGDHGPHLDRAREFIRSAGGLERTRAFTRIHLAFCGAVGFDEVPALPPWLVLLPDWAPLSIYDMSSWARSCVVPLSVLLDARFCVPLGVGLDELRTGGRLEYHGLRRNAFVLLDRALHRLPVPFRRRSREAALHWIEDHFEDSGDFGGIFPAMAYSVLALRALGYDLDAPTVRKGIEAIDRFGVREGQFYRVQSCVSPVWDTGLVVTALLDAGLPAAHPAFARATEWLLKKEVSRYGDWAHRARSGARPGGWSFEHHNTWYPDLDDTCVVSMALRRLGQAGPACARALEWVLAMQSKSGGWAAFDVDNELALLNDIPFADHGAMLDPPTPDITGRVLQLLGAAGIGAGQTAVRRALRFLDRTQEADGSWPGRWGVHHLYGTNVVVGGLRAIGIPETDPRITRAVAFYVRHQNADGGWGESCASYVDPTARASGPSTASQTAWAVQALVAAGLAMHPVTRRGVDWLCRNHQPDGGWEESAYTGTGFPGHFYIRYHLYRDHFPLSALGRWRSNLSAG